MDESKNWLSEHFSVVLGVATLSAVVVGVLGSAKLDPKADAPLKDVITINVQSRQQKPLLREIPRVPRSAHQGPGRTFRVVPHVTEVSLTPSKVTKKTTSQKYARTMAESTSTQPRQARRVQTYKVRPGDTLTKISRKVYGSSRYWKRIAEANVSKIGNYHRLRIGQVLIIPPKNAVSYANPSQVVAGMRTISPSTGTTGKSGGMRIYKVQKNDTWWTLAGKLLGDPTKWKALKKANSSASSRVLNVGTTLRY